MLAIIRGGSAYEYCRPTKIYFAWDNGLMWFAVARSFSFSINGVVSSEDDLKLD